MFAHAANGNTATSVLPIQATTIPLPQGPDNNLIDPQIIASSLGYILSPKVAGAHRKGKGKEKENVGTEKPKKRSRAVIKLDNDDDDLLPMPNMKVKHGRPQGANNYTTGDMTTLLDCVEVELLLGQWGWQTITIRFNKWAVKSAHPEWKVTSSKRSSNRYICHSLCCTSIILS